MDNNTQTQSSALKMVVGLDIGTTKILMVAGFIHSDGKVDVCGYGKSQSTGVENGRVFRPGRTIEDIKVALNQLVASIDEPVSEVYVGVAGRHIKSVGCTNSSLRPDGLNNMVTEEEVENMLSQLRKMNVKGAEVITVIPQYYEVEGKNLADPVGTLCQRLVGYYQVVTGDVEEVKRITFSVTGAGLQTKGLMLEPIASGDVCLSDQEKMNGVALIDIGGGTSDLVIYHQGGPVYVKVIPVGSQAITTDIENIPIPVEQAEYLKVNHGNCLPEMANPNNFITIPDSSGFGQSLKINERDLATVINARVAEDILKPIKRAIDESGYANSVKTVVLTGGGSQLKNLPNLTEFILQRRTRIGHPIYGLTNTIDNALKSPACSTALGLLRLGCLSEPGAMQDDFVSEEEEHPNPKSGNKKKDKESKEKKRGRTTSFFDTVVDWFGQFIVLPNKDGIN
ncbi:MAG: cell division protein FtsA [Bacteroidales bacterium]|nr:cell division protein FtsA [Bacteroidales bacterium]